MKKLFRRKENGDIAYISIFAIILILTIFALIVDFGLIYFQSARLQNAVDSATVSVAHELMSEDTTIKQTVEKYMEENGINIAKNSTGTISSTGLQTKIVYGNSENPNSVVVIDKKGLLKEEILDKNDGRYITSGYIKVTVSIRQKMSFAGVQSRMISKTGYAKCDIQYNDMPEALKYSLFANSKETHEEYKDASMNIVGRAPNAQVIVNGFVDFINKINKKFIQPNLKEPNFNLILKTDLSQAVLDADVHSNSDINIGVNGIVASRSKEALYNGSNKECVCKSLCKEREVNPYCTVCQKDYRNCVPDIQAEDDYNQVHFTAVNNICFSAADTADKTIAGLLSNAIFGLSADKNTHVYVRNYQYVEQTQIVLDVLNQLDFNKITSQDTLENAFVKTAEEYMDKNVRVAPSQREAVLAQKENLKYSSKNKYRLRNQNSIVYIATNSMANNVMANMNGIFGKSEGTPLTLSDFHKKVFEVGIDDMGSDDSLNHYDSSSKEYAVITFTKRNSNETAELQILGANLITRDLSNMNSIPSSTEAGYRFAIAKTFRQHANEIAIPNMKPYFVRAINNSVKNATTTKQDTGQTGVSDSTSVMEAVAKTQTDLENMINSKNTLATVENKDGTFSKTAADATNDPTKVEAGKADTYIDNSFASSDVLTNQATSPLLKFKLTSTDPSGNSMDYKTYTLEKYGSNDNRHTTYNGTKVFDKNGKLNSAKNVIDSYAKKNSSKYGKDAVKNFEKEDVLVDDDYNNSTISDYDKHYGSDAVAKKKHYIENRLTLSNDSKFEDSAPKKEDVFLMASGTKKTHFDNQIKKIEAETEAIDEAELTIPEDLRVDRVPSGYRTLVDATLADLGYDIKASVSVETESTSNISKNYIKPDFENNQLVNVDKTYTYEDLLPGKDGAIKKKVSGKTMVNGKDVDGILEETRKDFEMDAEQIGKIVKDKYNELNKPKSIAGWAKKGTVGYRAAENFLCENNRIVLEDKCHYEKIENAWSYGLDPYRYGIIVKSGSKVQVDGAFSLDYNKGYATTIIGDKSYSDYDEDDQDELKQTYLYVKGNVEISRCDVLIGDNTTVIVDGHVYVDGHSLTIGKNSQLICGYEIRVGGEFTVGENSVVVSKQANTSENYSVSMNTMVAEKGSEIYAIGDIKKVSGSDIVMNGKIFCQRAIFYGGGKGNMIFGEASQTFLGRDLSVSSGNITIGKNAIVVANRPENDTWLNDADKEKSVVDIAGKYTLNMKTGSVLVTHGKGEHRIRSAMYNCEKGSLIVTDMIKSKEIKKEENTSIFGNVICKKLDVRNTEFAENAHIFASEEIYVQDSKLTLTFNPGVKLILGNNTSGQSISNCGGLVFKTSPENKVFALGATGTISGFQKSNGNYTLYNGSFLSAPGLNINNLTIEQGGGFCIPKDSSITVNTLTIKDGTSVYIDSIKATKLVIDANASINKIESADEIEIKEGKKLLVVSNCNAKDIKNYGEFLVTNTLEVSGTFDNFNDTLIGVAKVSTNPGFNGKLICTGTINNHKTIQVIGSAEGNKIINEYSASRSTGGEIYVSGDFKFATVENKKDSKIICPTNLTATNLTNMGKIQAKNLVVTEKLLNSTDGEIRVDNTCSVKDLENNSILHISGSAEFNTVTNNNELKIDSNATFKGSVVNSANAKFQCTSYGATFESNVFNNGEMSIAGSIVAKGSFENNKFVCSNNQCYFSELQNKENGVVSICAFKTIIDVDGSKSGSKIENYGVIETYGGSFVNEIKSLENHGDFVSNVNIKDFAKILNYGKLECFGTLQGETAGCVFNNFGKVYCHSNVSVSGTITNGTIDNHDALFFVSASNSTEIYAYHINNYADFFAHDINVRVVDTFSSYKGSRIYVDKGNILTKKFEINAKCSLKYNGSFTISDTLVNRTKLKLTKISAKKIENEGTLLIDSGSKDFLIDYICNKKNADFAFAGSGGLQFTGYDDQGYSLWNEGNMYVNGNISAKGAIHATAGELYVYGDAEVSNSVSHDVDGVKNNVYMEGSAEFYVYGDVPRSSNSDGMMIAENPDAEAEKAVYSVYGYQGLGVKKSHDSGLINCYQTGAQLYFGGNLNVTPPDFISNKNTQTVKGSMYVYGEYTCPLLMSFYIEDGGVVYIKDNVNCALTTHLYLENFAGIYCFGNSVKFYSITANKSYVYLLKITNGNDVVKYPYQVTLENASVLFTPQNARIPSSKLYKSSDSFYAPDPNAYVSISENNFRADGARIVTSGNVQVEGEITIKEGQMLCANNIRFANNGKLNVKGTLYVTGKIYYNDGSTTSELSNIEGRIAFTGPKADVFIGRTKSGELEFNKELDVFGEQTLFFDNDIIVNGKLANNSKSKGGIGGNNLVPNRGEAIIVEGNSTLYVTGDVFSNGKNNNLGNAVYVGENCSLSCGGAFYSDSAIYNYGKFYVFGEFVNFKKPDGTEEADARTWPTDKGNSNYKEGKSILNGSSKNRNASIYIGGYTDRDKGIVSKNTIIFVGYVQNYGKINIMQDVYIKGYNQCSYLWMRTIGEDPVAVYSTMNDEWGAKASIVAEQGSRANFGGNVAMFAGYVTFNRDTTGKKEEMPVFSAERDATYGQIILNGGIFYAKGKVGYTGEVGFTKNVNKLGEADAFDNYKIRSLWIRYYRTGTALAGDWKGAYSIVNGFTFYPERKGDYSAPVKDAVFFAGGDLVVGTSESESDQTKIGGTIQNYGKMYVDGCMKSYSYEKYAINYVAISAQVGSSTFASGELFSNSGTLTMRNSMFMCDGNFISKRCARIGISDKANSEDDLNSSSYVYVGGNMAISTNGKGGAGDLAGSWGGVSTWNYFDVFSNANIYVGGSFFTNSIFTPHKNLTFIVDGLDKGGVDTTTNFITWLQNRVTNLSLKIDGYNLDDFKFIVNNRFDVQATLKEGRTKSMFNRFYVHGSALLNSRAKIPDMTKFYVYGDLVNRNGAGAIEIGRALNVTDDGDTWASKGTFVDENDEPRFIKKEVQNPKFDYNFANACYLYVQGNLDLNRRVYIYPGTTIRTGKDYVPRGSVKLMHDTSVYSGGKIATHSFIDVGQYSELFAKENIDAWNSICVREHGTLYSGGDVKCRFGFEAKTSATVFALGSIKSNVGTIKIRDKTKVFCGGNMTALRYIELGKFDEKYKDTLRYETPKSDDKVCTCTGHCTATKRKEDNKDDEKTDENPELNDYDADCPVCGTASNPSAACKAPYECICTEACSKDKYNSNCPVCNGSHGSDWQNCEAKNPDNTDDNVCNCDTKCSKENPNLDCPVCKGDYSKCSATAEGTTESQNDLIVDYTDKADGGEYYIGGALVSYLGHIREYGFSKVVVGKYVFTNRCLTVRSNSDMWVLPEAYRNPTYTYIAPTFESDGTIIGNIKMFFEKLSHNISKSLEFKNGSVYAMGNLTLNTGSLVMGKNASLMGTCDLYTFGKTYLEHDSLIYFGRDAKFSAPSGDIIGKHKGKGYSGFKSAGETYTTFKCTNKEAHPNGYTIYKKDYDPNTTYTCDKCHKVLDKKLIKHNVTCPVTIYAYRDISISTTTELALTYIVSCKGDVNIVDVASESANDSQNLYQLPNAIAAYNGNITYKAINGKISALFYAPAETRENEKKEIEPSGKITLDGANQEIWGSIIGNKIDIKTFNITLHRFQNWKTMNLELAQASNVYLVSADEYYRQKNEVDKSVFSSKAYDEESDGGASIFFDKKYLADLKEKTDTNGDTASG